MTTASAAELITQSEFARRHTVSRQAIGDLVTRGIIVLHEGKINETEALKNIAETRDPARAGKILSSSQSETTIAAITASLTAQAQAAGQGDPPSAAESLSYHVQKTRRETAEASKAELQLAALKGELINRAGIEMAIETAFRQTRDAIMAVPDRLAIPHATRALIRDALRDTLIDAQKIQPTLTDTGEPIQ